MAKSWTMSRQGCLLRPGAKATLVDFQRANPRFKRRTRNPEAGRCSLGSEYAPAACAPRILDDSLLVRGERAGQPDPGSQSPAPPGQPTLVPREIAGVPRHTAP